MLRTVAALLAVALACGGPDRPPRSSSPSAAPGASATPSPSPSSSAPSPSPSASSPLLFDAIGGPRHTAAWNDPLPKGALVRLGTTRVSDDSFRYLAVSHDGRHLATCSFYGNLLLWDAATVLPLRPIGKVEHCAGLLFTRDDRALLAVGFERVDRVDIATGRARKAWSLDDDIGDHAYTHHVAEVPGGSGDIAIARCSDHPDGGLVIYSPTGARRRGFAGFKQDLGRYCADHVRFSPDGKLLAATDSRTLFVFDRASGRRLRQASLFQSTPVAWSDRLYVAMDGAINALDPATLEATASFGFVRQHVGAGFTGALPLPAGRLLGLASSDPMGVRLYDATGAELARRAIPYPHELALSRDRSTALVLTEHPISLVARIDVASGRRLPPFDLGRHDGGITALAFRPDGAELATAADDGTSRTWDPATGKPRVTFAPQAGERIYAGETVAYLPDGSMLSAGSDCDLFRWDARRREILAHFQVPDAERCALSGLAVHPDGRQVAIAVSRQAGRDRTGLLRVLDLHTGSFSAPLPAPLDPYPVAMRYAGDRLLVGGNHGLAILHAGTGAVRSTIQLPSRPSSLAVLPGGATALIGFAPGAGVARVPLGGGPVQPLTLPAERRVGEAIALSPDGQRLAISASEKVWLYDLARNRVERTLGGHTADVEALAFDAAGTRLAAGAGDGTVLIFAVGGRR